MSWEDATKKIACLLKDDRDKNFIAHNDKASFNRWLSSGMLASVGSVERNRCARFQVCPWPRHARPRLSGPPLSRADLLRRWHPPSARRDDQPLGGYQERQCHPHYGWQPGGGASSRLQMGDRGEDQEQGKGHRRRPALQPLRRCRHLFADPRRLRHRFPDGRRQLAASKRQDPARLRARLYQCRAHRAGGLQLR